jgi:hypothetical protein
VAPPPILALLAVVAAGPPSILLAEPPEALGCAAARQVADVLSATPGIELLRAPLAPGASLEALRKERGAEVGLRLHVTTTGDAPPAWAVRVELARAGAAPLMSEVRGREGVALEALESIWPATLPPLSPRVGRGGPSLRALEAACRGEEPALVQLAGAALTLTGPPGSAGGESVAGRWARGREAHRTGDGAGAVRLLGALGKSLRGTERAPVWWRPPEVVPTAALSLAGELAVLFVDGVFIALELDTGRERWRAELGEATPEPFAAGDRLVVAGREELVALDVASGAPRWRLRASAPAPELARRDDTLFAATADEVLALDLQTGKVRWRHPLRHAPRAGPLLEGGLLLVPLETSVLALDPASGAERWSLSLPDELAAPLQRGPGDDALALVGSDELLLLDLAAGVVRTRLRWPALSLPAHPAGHAWLLAAGLGGKRPSLVQLALGGAAPKLRLVPRARPPLVPIPGGTLHVEGAKVVALGADGARRFALDAGGARPVLCGEAACLLRGSTLRLLDPVRGRQVGQVVFDREVRRVVFGARGGAALLADGSCAGLPAQDDPRLVAWARALEAETAEARGPAAVPRPASARRRGAR